MAVPHVLMQVGSFGAQGIPKKQPMQQSLGMEAPNGRVPGVGNDGGAHAALGVDNSRYVDMMHNQQKPMMVGQQTVGQMGVNSTPSGPQQPLPGSNIQLSSVPRWPQVRKDGRVEPHSEWGL